MDAVYRLALSLTHRRDQADDLVQETYLRAFRSRGDFKLTDLGLRPYLFKILHNALYTRLAKDGRQPKALLDGEAHEPAADCHQPPTDLSTLDWEKVDDRLMHAIDHLPLPHRTTFLLSAVEGLRYREIAQITDVPVGTVMSRLHRARQLLMADLADLARERRLVDGKISQGNESEGTR